MNTATFAGYIGRNAETKAVGDSTVTNFSIGVSTGWGDRKSTLWVACAIWGQRGDKLAQYLTKGTAITVAGDVDVRAYSAKDGTPKAEITCNVQRVTLQGRGDGEQQERQQEKPKGIPTSTGLPTGGDFEDDKDLPF